MPLLVTIIASLLFPSISFSLCRLTQHIMRAASTSQSDSARAGCLAEAIALHHHACTRWLRLPPRCLPIRCGFRLEADTGIPRRAALVRLARRATALPRACRHPSIAAPAQPRQPIPWPERCTCGSGEGVNAASGEGPGWVGHTKKKVEIRLSIRRPIDRWAHLRVVSLSWDAHAAVGKGHRIERTPTREDSSSAALRACWMKQQCPKKQSPRRQQDSFAPKKGHCCHVSIEQGRAGVGECIDLKITHLPGPFVCLLSRALGLGGGVTQRKYEHWRCSSGLLRWIQRR